MQTTKRLVALDNFRGCALFLMAAGDYLAGVKRIPHFLKHAPDIGLTIADIVAPFFIFAIALTYGQAFQRRYQTIGALHTYFHFVKRYATLISIGFVLSSGEIWVGVNQGGINWGVLQSIGFAGLLTLSIINRSLRIRLSCGLILLFGYQYLLDTRWHEIVLRSPHGGILRYYRESSSRPGGTGQGAFSWAAMLILATVLSDVYYRKTLKYFGSVSGLTILAGLALAYFIPISKNRVSGSYVVLCLGISALVFYLFVWLERRQIATFSFLNVWGKNPLLIYLLHDFLLAIFVLPPFPHWYTEANLALVSIQLAAFLLIINFIVQAFNRRELIISL